MENNYNPRPIFLVIFMELNAAIKEKNWEKVKLVAERLKEICTME